MSNGRIIKQAANELLKIAKHLELSDTVDTSIQRLQDMFDTYPFPNSATAQYETKAFNLAHHLLTALKNNRLDIAEKKASDIIRTIPSSAGRSGTTLEKAYETILDVAVEFLHVYDNQ